MTNQRAGAIKNFYGKKVAILGFDREGTATYRFLMRNPEFRGAEIWILDKNKNVKIPAGVRTRLGVRYLEGLEKFDLVYRTPGVRYKALQIQRTIKRGVKVSSGTKLFFERCPAKIIGVTGTKGKGTTSTLIYEMLAATRKKVFLGGNIGTPAVDLLPSLDKNTWVVLEMSSFQLMDLTQSPHIGVALMVTSEHLDWHTSVQEYATAKSNIVRHQFSQDFAVLANDYPRTMAYAKKTKGTIFTFSRNHPVKRGAWVEDGYFFFSNGKQKEKICKTSELRIPGQHNWDNACAAITVAKILGIPNVTIAKTLTQFKGLKHRLEFVREFGGVRYYNDSYSTTPDASEVAVQAFAAPKIMILGGSPKNSDFKKLGKLISKSKTMRAVIGIGKEWPRIKAQIKNRNIPFIEGYTTMDQIVKAARGMAKAGDVVILSPGCASFDMFKNYTDRGDQFRALVKKLK